MKLAGTVSKGVAEARLVFSALLFLNANLSSPLPPKTGEGFEAFFMGQLDAFLRGV